MATLDMPAQSLTKSAVILDASSSYDPDGGEFIGCNFFVENEDGIVEISGGKECIVEFEWDDDGYLTSSWNSQIMKMTWQSSGT